MREYSTGFEGVVRTLMRRHDETDSDQMKQYYESYMREVPCQACHGRRLRPEVLAVTVDDESIADVCDMSAERSLAWINGLELEGSAAQIAASDWPPRSAPAWWASCMCWTNHPSACISVTTNG